MDALLTEAMVCRQLDFNGHHLTERRAAAQHLRLLPARRPGSRFG